MNKCGLKYKKPLNYSNRVLIGSWVEERNSYKKNAFKHTSVYSDEYIKKSRSKINSTLVWDIKLKAEGFGIYPIDASEKTPNFFNNFSTTYDLSFNHFPKWYGDSIYRDWRFRLERHEPFDEYIKSYGNITETGLTNYKKQEWTEGGVQDPRTTVTSDYKNTYISPEEPAYQFRRWPRPRPIKTKDGDMIYLGYPKDHPSLTKCNPLTGECKMNPLQNYL